MADIAPVRLAAPPAVSVVVPTRNEAENVRPLVEQLREALGATPAEIVFVDDSDDDTPATVTALSERDPDGVRLVHRAVGERTGGLGGAVAAGLAAARAPWVVVMDGDLQHPPETVPALLAAGRRNRADAVVASRYRTPGRVDGLSGGFRRLVSRASGTLAKVFFPRRLRAVTDPMSGFFAVRREAVDLGALRPRGYKILLEVVVRSRMARVDEVPYTFRPRAAGESKASFREGVRYLRHLSLLRLAATRHPVSPLGRMTGFALAGGAGTAVNSAALWALGEVAGLPYLLAGFLAVQVAIVWNFAVIDNLVMPPGEHARHRRFGRFLLLNNSLTPVHLGLLFGLVQWGGLHYLPANLVAIVVVFTLRYAVTSRWVYGAPPSGVVGTLRRAVQTRLLLAALLTAVAFPALVAIAWNGLWTRGDAVPLLIPVAAGAALAARRIRPGLTEPDVHDRQVDGLLAAVLLTAAGTLLALMPSPGWLVPAALAFLAGSAILLVGTRAVARLRWALLLPLVAIGGVMPAVDGAVDAGLRAVVTLLGRPAGPTSSDGGLVTAYKGAELLLPAHQLPGLALAGGMVCLLISAVVIFGWRGRAVLRAAAASTVLAAVTVGAVLAVLLVGRLLGPGAFRIAQLPVFVDILLAVVVAVVVARWSPVPDRAPARAVRQHLPRGRFVLVALLAMAVLLSVRTLPQIEWITAGGVR
ncbi:glycosyltransferase [Actinoplanes flavus]|uniref:Glycosyltransferase n=1 Tax=Actinoplanes flavus TaxID=2820290 RepID=A0ABS3UGV9_9ACTN|nr:glycosyltransferase [Actinoplanes flavus]MBO3736998.1 glycosyltransferase [Actinoplanes flavus]